MMAHELRDRRQRIDDVILMMGNKEWTPHDFIRLIMSLGYNRRGARALADDLEYLGKVVKKKGLIYAKK